MKSLAKLTTKRAAAVKEFVALLDTQIPHRVKSLSLYGSSVRGTAGRFSDIDVMIVLDRDDSRVRERILDATVKILLQHEVEISPVIYSRTQFQRLNRLPTTFLQIVMREAIRIK